MADSAQAVAASPRNEPTVIETTEDAETRAARRELKQSSISDQNQGGEVEEGVAKGEDCAETPTEGGLVKNVDLKEHGSPKKKRAHDQLGEDHECCLDRFWKG